MWIVTSSLAAHCTPPPVRHGLLRYRGPDRHRSDAGIVCGRHMELRAACHHETEPRESHELAPSCGVRAFPIPRGELVAKLFSGCVDRGLGIRETCICRPGLEPCPGAQFPAGPIFLPTPTPSSQMEIRVGGSSPPFTGFLLLSLYFIISYLPTCSQDENQVWFWTSRRRPGLSFRPSPTQSNRRCSKSDGF